jgi:hypothetical protein
MTEPQVGNELGAKFESTASKSRLNFLKLCRKAHEDYVVNEGALEYMARQRLPKAKLSLLEAHEGHFDNREQWETHLKELGVTSSRHIKIATFGL